MSHVKQLIHEIHRRSLWQVLAIYVATSWVVFEVVQTLTEGLGLPDWVPGFAFVLLLIGLPIVLATAFVQEGVSIGAPTEAASPRPAEEAAPPGAEGRPAPARPGGARRLFTWRNAILGGVLGFTLLGVGTAGYMGMRVLGIGPMGTLVAKGVVGPGERIVLAEFENLTADSLLGLAVTEALRTDLSQSRLLWLAEPDYVRRVLARMGRETQGPLDYELAREVAIREGLRAVIAGQVSSVGTGNLLTARVVAAETGEVVASWREAAEDSTEIIPAIDRLSKRMRERVGESLPTIRAGRPLPEVTTGSLEALKKFSAADQHFNRIRYERAIPLYEQAIALDSTFGAAYRRLGVARANSGERARAVEAITRAYELRHRMTERMRLTTVGLYHDVVGDAVDSALTAYRTLVEISDSTDVVGLVNLGNVYSHLRDNETAEKLYRRAVEIDSFSAIPWSNLARIQMRLGKLDEAERTYQQIGEKVPEAYWRHSWMADLAAYRGDYAAAEARIVKRGEAGDTRDERLRARAVASRMSCHLALLQGKPADARRHCRDAVETALQRGPTRGPLDRATDLGLIEIFFGGDRDAGIQTVETVLERHPLDGMTPLDRPYLRLARFYALADRPVRAREKLTEYEEAIDPKLRESGGETSRYHRTAGAVALAEGGVEEAIALLRLGDERECHICALPLLGRSYDLAGETDSAMAVYERYLAQPYEGRTLLPGGRDGVPADAFWLPVIYERLAVLYEDRGNVAKALHYHGRLVEPWKDADPELQPRVEAARRAIRRLSGEP